MRKTIITALLSLAAVAAGAQTLSEALNYSGNNYYGTARSIALGNAMTALGGDLGSVGINPAGSAVAPYSQFTISPGITVMSNYSAYSSCNQEDYGNGGTYSRAKFVMPNFASVVNFETYKPRGLKNFTIGFLFNTTDQYLNDFIGTGRNSNTSILGSFAAGANPYTPEALKKYDNFYDSTIPWNYLMAYQAGMIGEAMDEAGKPIKDASGNYIYLGTTEGMTAKPDGDWDIRTLGALDQYSRVQTYGSKTDFIMNWGLNFNDNFFLGFNLGMPIATYHYDEYFREAAVDPSDFEVEYVNGAKTNFSHATYDYSQTTDISGVYAKAGFIWLPVQGLRIGATIQTPTLLTVEDYWYVDGSTNFTDSQYNPDPAGSPENDYKYDLATPWRFSAGAALTFGDRGLISADLEMADYSSMKFSEFDSYNNDYFYVENKVNRNFAGMEYTARFGAEYRVIPEISVRAGFGFKTSPERLRYDSDGNKLTASDYLAYYDDFESGRMWLCGSEAVPETIKSYSFGFGYSSDSSFFADVAFRWNSYPTKYFSPYYDYITGGTDYLPEIENTRTLMDMVLTFGWRF